MDFMFEDEVDEVGSDVEAYCPKCKADTTHVVISKYEDEIRRVQCNPCGDVHSFRKPRGEVEDDVPEPIAAKKRAMLKKVTWEEFFAKHAEKAGKPYEFREHYSENAIVTHPKFGKGFVSEVLSDSKVEISFKDARRVLVHNRKDMPGLPLAAEGDGIPSKSAKAKAVKNKAAKADAKAEKGQVDLRAAAAKALPPAAAKASAKPDGADRRGDKDTSAQVHAQAKKAAAPASKAATVAKGDKKGDKKGDAGKSAAKAPPAKPGKPAAKAAAKPTTKAATKSSGKPPAKAAKGSEKSAKKKR